MTNHPNRTGYNTLIARLQRLSASAKVAPDCRRLLIGAYQRMMVAKEPPRYLDGISGYINRGPLATASARRAADKAAIDAEIAANMAAAEIGARELLARWSL